MKHSSTLLRAAQRADLGALVGGQVVQDHVDRGAVRAGGADRLQRGQGVRGALPAAVDAPQGVVADASSSRGTTGRRGCCGSSPAAGRGGPARRPAGAAVRADRQRPELVEREHPVREAGPVTCSMRSSLASRSGSVDSFQVLVRWKVISWRAQELPQPFAADPDRPGRGLSAQVGGEFAHAPAGERLAELARGGWWPSRR